MYTIAILLVLSLIVLKALNSSLRTRKTPSVEPITVEPTPMDDKVKKELQRLKKVELQKIEDDIRLHSYMTLDMERTLNNEEFKEYMRLRREIKEKLGI